MPTTIKVTQFAPTAAAATITGTATGREAKPPRANRVAPKPCTLVFEFLDGKGAVVANQEVQVPALKAGESQPIEVKAAGSRHRSVEVQTEVAEGDSMAGVRAQHAAGSGLTTTKAPFIEQAQEEGRLYIHQPYELYSEANHDAWRRLFSRMEDRWRRYANPAVPSGHRQPVPRSHPDAAAGGCQPISQPAHRVQGQAGERLHPLVPLLRLPAKSRVSHHHHHPGRRHARLSARAGHLPRHRRATSRCTPIARLPTPWCGSATAPIRRPRSWRASGTRRRRSAGSPASSRRWRGSSGSRSSSV